MQRGHVLQVVVVAGAGDRDDARRVEAGGDGEHRREGVRVLELVHLVDEDDRVDVLRAREALLRLAPDGEHAAAGRRVVAVLVVLAHVHPVLARCCLALH